MHSYPESGRSDRPATYVSEASTLIQDVGRHALRSNVPADERQAVTIR
jgi:hypothetical protein